MSSDFVSEVDRKFFANNMLSMEDWDACMELTDFTERECNAMPLDMKDAYLEDGIQLSAMPEGTHFPATTHDDLLNEWSDSSDSGVSGLLNSQSTDDVFTIKYEPLSPTLSHHSDSCDSGISQSTDSFPPSILHSPVDSHSLLPDSQQTVLSEPYSPSDHAVTIKPETGNSVTMSHHHMDSIMICGETHIDTILNSKIKIKPKPGEPCIVKKAKLDEDSSPQKSLVITAEEFQRLTTQGVLRFQPPKQESILKAQALSSITPAAAVSVACKPHHVTVGSSNPLCVFGDKDTKLYKRQQRMIKNRESASLSRKRKKEYMSSLEDRLKQFSDENEKLRQENLNLKRKLSELHSENECLKKTFPIAPTIKKTIVFALFIMLSFNFGTWSSVFTQTNMEIEDKLRVPPIHKGRQLMSVPEVVNHEAGWSMDRDTVSKLHNLILEYSRNPNIYNPSVYNVTDVPPMCPTYFNKTESMRLAKQLAGWMYRHEEKKKVVKNLEHTQKEKQLRPISYLRRAMRDNLHMVDKKYHRSMDARFQVQVFKGADTGKDFLKAMHHRNDTFYVLSFDEDYYLVPAVFHNKTSRPRMSLVMPAVALNESMMPADDHVGMMQIDCEVMNTQLIHVRKLAIPRRVRERYNNTYYHQEGMYP